MPLPWGDVSVTDAEDMDGEWYKLGLSKAVHRSTMEDAFRALGKGYHILTDNCKHGADRVMQLR